MFRRWIILIFVALLAGYPVTPNAAESKQSAHTLIKRADREKDPVERVRLLEEVLQKRNIKSRLLAQVYLKLGLAHKEAGDCFRAIRSFDLSLGHSSDLAQALLEKAECLVVLNQLDDAARSLARAGVIVPKTAQIYILKGMIYEKQGFLSRAEDEYSRALHCEPKSVEALEKRTQVRFHAGKPRAALEDANELIRQVRNRAEPFLTRARIYAKLKQYQKAIKDYKTAESLGPADAQTIREKVLVLFSAGKPEQALKALADYPADDREDVDGFILRARAHIFMGNYETADEILMEVMSREPSHAPAFLYSGVIAMKRRRWDQALEFLNRSLTLDPSLVEAYKQRAGLFIGLEQWVRAASDLTAALDLDPSDGELFALRGLTLMKRKLFDAAVADYSRALRCLPGDPAILFDRAVAFTSQDRWDLAIADLDAALAARPDAARALSLRAIANFRSGMLREARVDFDKSTAVGPDDPVVWNNRGFFHYKMGDYKAAVVDFNRALSLAPDYSITLDNLAKALRKQDAQVSPSPTSRPTGSARYDDTSPRQAP